MHLKRYKHIGRLFWSILFLLLIDNIIGQTFNKNIDKDSLLKVNINYLSEEKKKEFLKVYKRSDKKNKDFLLYMLSMPKSSKKELIENFEKNSKQIFELQREFLKFIPDSLKISVEINPYNHIFNTKESFSISICHYLDEMNSVCDFISYEWGNDCPESIKKM